MREGVCLYPTSDFKPGITLIPQAKDPSESIERQIAYLQQCQSRRLPSATMS
jgi:hypothetical protein